MSDLGTTASSSPREATTGDQRLPTPKWALLRGVFGGSGNCVLRYPEFYISYNRNPGSGFSSFRADGGAGDETALVKNDKFFILNGDFRAEYETLASQGFDACHAFFEKTKAAHGSSWTTGAA